MSGTYIEVDERQIGKDAAEYANNIAEAKRKLEEFKTELDSLNNLWTGKANEAFKKQVEKDYIMMKSVISELEKLCNSIKNAKKEYQRCEIEVNDVINKIKI